MLITLDSEKLEMKYHNAKIDVYALYALTALTVFGMASAFAIVL